MTKSWVIADRATGEAIMETWNPELVRLLNTAKYRAVPILEWLHELNRQIRRASVQVPAGAVVR